MIRTLLGELGFENQEVAECIDKKQTGNFLQDETKDLSTIKVLLVNDEIVSLMILQQILERSIGVNPDNIFTAENGKIAYELS